MMRAIATLFIAIAAGVATATAADTSADTFRPPAVPLVVQDPYVSIWSAATTLTESWTQFWDGSTTALAAAALVDGTCYRLMGPPNPGSVCPGNAATQEALVVNATRTEYTFRAGGARVALRFRTPALLDDLDALALPLTFVDMAATAADGAPHAVALYFDTSAEPAVSSAAQPVRWATRVTAAGTTLMRVGTQAQTFNGDNGAGRICWGWWTIAVPAGGGPASTTSAGASAAAVRAAFAAGRPLPPSNNTFRAAGADWPVFAVRFDLGKVGTATTDATARLVVAFDDSAGAIEYFGDMLKPRWAHTHGGDLARCVEAALASRAALDAACDALDARVNGELGATAGGARYAKLGALAYRQVTGALKLVWNDKANDTWAFVKEISSDGDVSTVARQLFAEHSFRSSALQCTATARILIPAECSAIS